MRQTSIETSANLDVKNLCSRKLFEMLTIRDTALLDRQQQRSVELELEERRHYLRELNALRAPQRNLAVGE